MRKCTLPFYKVRVDLLPPGVTSFVATSDLQGRKINKDLNRLVGEAIAEELLFLQDFGEVPKIDFVILAGDLYDYPDCRKLGGTGDVTSVWNSFAKAFDFVVGVNGNHDIVLDKELENNAIILDGDLKNIKGIQIGGISGIIGNTDRNQRKTHLEFDKSLQRVVTRKTDIIIMHQGPDDLHNGQPGEPLIREYLEDKGSSIVIFGHCHWSKAFIEIGNNQALNVDNRLYLFCE